MKVAEYVRRLPLRDRLRLWLARFRVRSELRRGWQPQTRMLCCECLQPIIERDGNACVCIPCSGRIRDYSPPRQRRAADSVPGELPQRAAYRSARGLCDVLTRQWRAAQE